MTKILTLAALLLSANSYAGINPTNVTTSATLDDGSVTTSKIAAGAVTTSKIAVEALTPLKLDAANGRASINLTTPLSALAVNGASASGPTATDKGIFQFQSSADAIGMSAGAYSASPYGLYFQGHDPRSGQNSTYPLLLNPIGGNVGIGTTNPTTKFQVDAGTFSVYSTGIVSAPGQPYVIAQENSADVFTNAVESKMFFQAPAAGNDTMSMWGGTSSSGTFTVPTNGAGFYHVKAKTFVTLIGTFCITIKKNGSAIETSCGYDSSGNFLTPTAAGVYKLAAGDALTAFVTQTSGAAQSPDSVSLDASVFSAVKVW